MENAPRWFLVVGITAVISLLPFLIRFENRLTTLEVIQSRQIEDRKLFLQTISKMDKSVEKLADAVQALQIEVSVMKEK